MLSWTLRGSPFWGAVALLLACFWGQPRVRAASVGSGSCCYVSSLVHSLVQAQTQQQNLDPGSWFTLEYEADDKSNRAPDLGWVIMALKQIGIWVQTRIYNPACYHCSLFKMLRDGFGVLFFSRLFLGVYVRSERNKDIRGYWALVYPWEEEIRPATSVHVFLGFFRINIYKTMCPKTWVRSKLSVHVFLGFLRIII